MIVSKNLLVNYGVGLFFIANDLAIVEVRKRLVALCSQSIEFREVHLFINYECVQSEISEQVFKNIQIHIVPKNIRDHTNWFHNILKESKCDQIILSNGLIHYVNKYSLERFSLQTRLWDKTVSMNHEIALASEKNQICGLFGILDNFIFSREWLLKENISLFGLTKDDQEAFLAEIFTATESDEMFFDILDDGRFAERAEHWASSFTEYSFLSGILLCTKLFEIADRRNCSELIRAAGILTQNIIRMCGRFVSPFVEDSKENRQLNKILLSLAETIQDRTEILNAYEMSEEIRRALTCPLVSVIVPVYNVEKELTRCLDSIFSQTLRSIEVICVNDGSKDNSLNILRQFEEKYQNCRVMTQENSGQATARNRAIAVANGKYIGFVDSDDWIEPYMFEKMAMELEKHPEAQIAKCGMRCDFTYSVSESERKGSESYFTEPEPEGVHVVGPDHLLTGVVCDKLYRASFIKDNNIRFPEGLKNEDEAFALFCVCRAKNYVLLKDKFYHYIKNETGTMNTQIQRAVLGKIPDVFDICNLMLDFLHCEKQHGYFGRVIKTILGAADRFEGMVDEEKLLHIVSTLLEKAQYQWHVETIVQEKRAWCKRKAVKFLNYYSSEPFVFRDLAMWLPGERQNSGEAVAAVPKITFVVPVYNVERFLVPSIESLRNQSLRDIEILCIDDGSSDCSLEILEHYQQIDDRVRVLTQSNSGVSATRNRGIDEARGKYIAFVDGDDYLSSTMAEECFKAAESNSLDVVSFDYQCFDCISGKMLDHYWTISNRAAELPLEQVFGAEAFQSRSFSFYGASWCFLWKKSFLKEYALQFLPIRISEDMCFVVNALSDAERVMILPKVFYYYRRNVPGSAITSLKIVVKEDPRFDTIPAMCDMIESISKKNLSMPAKANIMGRLLSELKYFSTLSVPLKNRVSCAVSSMRRTLIPYISMLYNKDLQEWLQEIFSQNKILSESISMLPSQEKPLPQLDRLTSYLWKQLQKKRRQKEHDAIVVISFLGSPTADPIDSWTFFSWLQDHKIPSYFVTSANSIFYQELVRQHNTKDVIALGKSCLQDEHAAYFLRKLFEPLSRAKAVVFEDFVWPWPLRERFKREDWKLIFLQHGVMYFAMNQKYPEFFSRFNLVNVSSMAEKEFLEKTVGSYDADGVSCPKYMVAGLPRWDRLNRNNNITEQKKIVFIMFTWRKPFQNPGYKISESTYVRGITSLMNSSILIELKSRGVQVVFAPHHRLLDLAPEVVQDWPLEICQQSEISYWVKNASCLITDYSSIAWDFMFQQKPVIHWIMDYDDTSLGNETLAELAFTKKKVCEVSSPVYSIGELQERIKFYEENGFQVTEADFEKMKPFFPYAEGFSQRVYETLCCDIDEKGIEI